jgi:serine phosphatase RsbU (regulator of sigma subunit)
VREGVAQIDAEGRFTHVDAEVARMIARPAAELIGMAACDLIPAGGDCFVWEPQRRSPGDDAPLRLTTYTERSDQWLEMTFFPVAGGSIAYYRAYPENEPTCAHAVAAQTWDGVTVGSGRGPDPVGIRGWSDQIAEALDLAMTFSEISGIVARLRRQLDAAFSGVLTLGRHGGWEKSSADTELPAIAAAWSEMSRHAPSPAAELGRLRGPRFDRCREDLLAVLPERRWVFEAGGFEASSHLPLVADGRQVGALLLAWTTVRTFDQREQAALAELAGRLAAAVDRATRYEAERAVIRTMAKAFQPPRLPIVAGLRLAARYRPVSVDRGVGGDWYELVPMSDGTVAVMIGDVVGHGPSAAVTMNDLRNAARAYMLRGADPARVAGRLSADLLEMGDDETLATAVIASLDPITGRFTWSCAGHMPPLLVAVAPPSPGPRGERPAGSARGRVRPDPARPDGAGEEPAHGDAAYADAADRDAAYADPAHADPVYLDAEHGPMLGVQAGQVYCQSTVLLPAGSVLLLYTDGLLERRAADLPARLPAFARLAATVVRSAGPNPLERLEEVCDRLLADLSGAGGQEDDLCLLALAVGTPAASRPPGV